MSGDEVLSGGAADSVFGTVVIEIPEVPGVRLAVTGRDRSPVLPGVQPVVVISGEISEVVGGMVLTPESEDAFPPPVKTCNNQVCKAMP